MSTLLGRRFHINKRETVTDAEGDDAEVRESGTTVAPSLVKEPRIVFTGVSGAAIMKMKQIINRLGGIEVDAKDYTHLVTSRLTRTIKFLCAISVAKHMVTTGWIVRTGDVCYFVDETEFALKDQYAETIYGFNIPASLKKAQCEKTITSGLTFYCTPQVIPCPKSLREMTGGEVWL
ncbi:PAX-interacting protein 1-like isoform X2 [Dysidea avara]|uniref:PAX-interacting protein 1-like isoform X2 n=1 Tax=Dysidea avara TaxID=196820 RepID=UPI00332E8086